MTLRLEVFDLDEQISDNPVVVLDLLALEEAKLAAYDQGYTAGWDDAASAQTDEQSRMRTDLARHLQALGFSYQEARIHVLKNIEPLLIEVVSRLLPPLARITLAPLVVEGLMPLAATLADSPVTLVLNPAARPAVESLLERMTGLPLILREEPSLGEGQVYLRFGPHETEIDLDRAIADITAAVRGFFDLATQEPAHGQSR